MYPFFFIPKYERPPVRQAATPAKVFSPVQGQEHCNIFYKCAQNSRCKNR